MESNGVLSNQSGAIPLIDSDDDALGVFVKACEQFHSNLERRCFAGLTFLDAKQSGCEFANSFPRVFGWIHHFLTYARSIAGAPRSISFHDQRLLAATKGVISVHFEEISVATKFHKNTPCIELPSGETKSISKKPGSGSFRSARHAQEDPGIPFSLRVLSLGLTR